MFDIDIMYAARALIEKHGEKALEEAAKRARSCDAEGKKHDAERWRRIEAVLREMKKEPPAGNKS